VKRSRFALLVLALAACGDDGAPVDSGAGDGGDSASVTPPDIPWLAEGAPPALLTDCPSGWREVAGLYAFECDPYPVGGAATCGPGEAHFPGEAACRPVGDPCPVGDFADGLIDDGTVVYVRAGAASGDGSLATPFGALSDVRWTSLAAGTTVALARGTYEGTLPLRAATRVVGACAGETVVVGPAAPIASLVSVTTSGEPAVVRNLTITDSLGFGAMAEEGRRLSLEGVIVERANEAAVMASGTAAEITMTSVVIRDTRTSGRFGRGVVAQEAGRIEASFVLVEGNRDTGVFASDSGSEIVINDSVVRDTLPQQDDDTGGRGIGVQTAARLEATRVLVEANREAGMYVSESECALTDVVVRGTRAEERDGTGGHGLELRFGARGEIVRLLVAENQDVGIFISDPDTSARLDGIVVRNVEADPSGSSGGRGLVVADEADVEATRLLVADNGGTGVYVSGGATLTLTDAAVRGIESETVGGRGVNVQLGARLTASRLLVTDSREAAMFIGDADVVLRDALVRDTRARASDGVFGRGLNVQGSSTLDAERIRVEASREFGIVATRGASATMRDASIVGTERASCAATTCAARPYGYGAAAVAGALGLSRFEVRDAATCGVFLAGDPTMPGPTEVDLAEGVVAESEIGACVQVDDYDLMRLTNGVEYRDNTTNLDTTMLPVPGLIDDLADVTP